MVSASSSLELSRHEILLDDIQGAIVLSAAELPRKPPNREFPATDHLQITLTPKNALAEIRMPEAPPAESSALPATHRAPEEAEPLRQCVPRPEPWNEDGERGWEWRRSPRVAFTEKCRVFVGRHGSLRKFC